MAEIFLIDDDKIQNLLIKGIARKINSEINIVYFSNPLEALSNLENKGENEQPLLILLDLNMPELTGWEFLERYELFAHKTRVVILTSSIDNSDITRSTSNPSVLEYFSKPLSINQLENLVNRVSVS